MSKPGIILTAGPTASGKSALALALAEQYGGTIINADSMQVYRDLRIITARPTAAEEERAPHRLYGHVDAGENFSVGRWCREAAAALAAARRAASHAIIVGGTGLYFSALTRGLAAVPAIPAAVPQVRERQLDGARRFRAGSRRDLRRRATPARASRALEVVLAMAVAQSWQDDERWRSRHLRAARSSATTTMRSFCAIDVH